jgi:hypothetical protein
MLSYYFIPKEYRPLDLLFFKTRRPEEVFIRALKPDVRDLFNFVPLNVLFVIYIN